MRHLALLEQAADGLALFDAGRADQDRLALGAGAVDQLGHGDVLLGRGAVHLIVAVGPNDRDVGRDVDHLELVDLGELVGLGQRGAGHAGELGIQAEVVLEGDRGEGLVLRLDGDELLGLERLVQALAEAAALHHAAGELVDQHDLVLFDNVVDVAVEQRVGAQGLLHVMKDGDVEDVVHVAVGDDAVVARHLLDALAAGLGQGDGLELLVLVVGLGVFGQHLHQRVHAAIQIAAVLGGAGDDERGARLVHQDAVDLVDDRVGEVALRQLVQAELHVVAQVVEAELVVGAVGDVAVVGLLALALAEAVDDHAGGQAHEAIQAAHPFGVAHRQVVVDGDDVDAAAVQGVEVDRQCGDQGLALAGLHLGDLAVVQHHAPDHLHVEMAQAQRAARGFAHDRERFGQQLVQRGALGQAGAELGGLGAQRVVIERLHRRLERVDLGHPPLIALQRSIVGGAEHGAGERGEHGWPSRWCGARAGAACRVAGAGFR